MSNKLQQRIQRVLGMLAAQFLLGMAVNLIGLPSETAGSAQVATYALGGLHAVLGVGLLVGAFMVAWLARKVNKSVDRQAHAAFGAVIVAFAAGVGTALTESNWWSFVMAAGFIAAVFLYGMLYVRVMKLAS